MSRPGKWHPAQRIWIKQLTSVRISSHGLYCTIRTRRVLDLLADESLEDDKPEKLKELLVEVTSGTESVSIVPSTPCSYLHAYADNITPPELPRHGRDGPRAHAPLSRRRCTYRTELQFTYANASLVRLVIALFLVQTQPHAFQCRQSCSPAVWNGHSYATYIAFAPTSTVAFCICTSNE